MPQPLSQDLRQRVLTAYQAGLSYLTVAKRFGVSVSTVRRLNARQQEVGNVQPLPPSNGYRRALSPEDEEALVLWNQDHPDWFVHEYRTALKEKLKVHVSETAVRRALKRLGLRRKKRLSMPRSS
jgi:transposase